jgi:tRNA (guanosine-2'-O-)-methyltransferase
MRRDVTTTIQLDAAVAALHARLAAHPLACEVTPRRLLRIAEVLAARLASVTVVMENVSDPHNASAVVRTAEGFGLDAIHVVEQPNPYEKNRSITRGADRWISVHRHKGLARCLGDLSAQGFTLYAADVGTGCVPLDEIPVTGPVALVFGSEHAGLSKRALSLTDARFTVPMQGFVESFNVSVSAAVALYDVSRRRRLLLQRTGDLGDDVLDARGDVFLRRSIKNEALIRHRLTRPADA